MRFQYFIDDFDPEKALEVGYIDLEPSQAAPGQVFRLGDNQIVTVEATAFPKRMLRVRRINGA